MSALPARPVTPVGIAAQLLDSVAARLDGVDPDLRTDLDRARALLSGLESYVDQCASPPSVALQELEQVTRREPWAAGLEQEMLSGAAEGAFLRMLVAITGARRVLEIGMFTGYSALAMAEALPGDGRLVACEVDEHAAGLARRAFGASPVGSRIEVRMGPALDTLRDLAGVGETFDLVFVDADKSSYVDYVDAVLGLDLLMPDGVVAIDNTLLQGEPWAMSSPSGNGGAIARFNAWLADDPRVEQVLVPLRDGVTLVRRAP